MAIGARPAKNELFDTFAAVASTLAAGRRLEIIDVLAQAPRSVEQIADEIDQSVANTSHHLRRLADAGLVAATRQGRHVVYALSSRHVYELWRALQEVAATHSDALEAAAASYLGDRGEIERMDLETLQELLEREDVVVIDVRPAPEYAAGHLAGATSVPPDELASLLPALPADRDIVAYCRGPFCAYADQAVLHLQALGRTAYRLDVGYLDWSAGD